MKNLVSRNPVQRFKQGRKIVKAQGGVKTSRRTPGGQIIYDNNSSEPRFFSRFWSYLTSPQQSRVGMNGKPIVDTVAKQNTYKTPELKGSKEAYLNRLQQQGFTAKPTNKVDTTQTQKSQLKPQSKLQNNIWIKGYNRHPEITDVRAMQQKLLDLGLLKGSKFGVDGKWGRDTEAAYQKYLNLKNIPVMNQPIARISPAEQMEIYTEETKPLYQKIGLVLKQGGSLLPLRNPIKRFKLQRKGL